MTYAFGLLQEKIAHLIQELGGGHAARAIVTKLSARYVMTAVTDHLAWDMRHHLLSSAWVLATDEDFICAIESLEYSLLRPSPIYDQPIEAESESFMGGHLVLRARELRFETPTAGYRIAAMSPERRTTSLPNADDGQWDIWIDEETANPLLDTMKLARPEKYRTRTQSKDGAIKSLERIAKQVFKAPLQRYAGAVSA